MKYFVPDIHTQKCPDAESDIIEKFGGLPWGISLSDWPKCKDCGKSQSFIAQFRHDSNRINLGKPGRMLFLFQCNHDPGMCSTWEGGSGCNACFILDPEKLNHSFCKLPSDSPVLENEVFIVGWEQRDDEVSLSDAPSFYDEDKLLSLPEAKTNAVTSSTRFGSVPYWIQGPSEAPHGWEFLGQIDSTLSFTQERDYLEDWISKDPERWEGRSHYAEGPNFGDGGIAYLFLKSETNGPPKGWFFWQC